MAEAPRFYLPMTDGTEVEGTRDNARLFTHAEQYRTVDHIFLELERVTKAGAQAIRGFFCFREELPNFDDVANYMIENDYWCLHQFEPDQGDEEMYERIASRDLDNGIPEEWPEEWHGEG